MKKIYILSTYTGTALSYLIRKITKVPYAHVSIGLDKDLNEVYSFGRKHVSNPIFAGFVREYIDDGLYKKKVNAECKVFSLEITDEEYDKVCENLNYFIVNRKMFKYDATALVKLLYGKPRENTNQFVCSQFVAYVLEKSGVKIFDKSSNLVTPMDFYTNEKLQVEYEGLLRNYRKKELKSLTVKKAYY